MVTGNLWMALGGWLPAAGRDIRQLPNSFSGEHRQEHGVQTGASQTCPGAQARPVKNKIDWLQGLKNVRFILRGVNSMDKPNGRLVLVSYTHYCASTSSLSTKWSSWALQGDLILRRASRLYAFSGYHNRTSLPSRALGRTTGTQEVRPSRSSRTKDSPSQISYAHSR